jgi:hypothetical protein
LRRSVVNFTPRHIASGVEAAADDWVKVWVDPRSKYRQAFVTIGLLEGSSNRHVFTAGGHRVGGFEISPPRAVQLLSQVSAPTTETPVVTQVIHISELPPFPESSSARIDEALLVALATSWLRGPQCSAGQRILRLIAPGPIASCIVGALR